MRRHPEQARDVRDLELAQLHDMVVGALEHPVLLPEGRVDPEMRSPQVRLDVVGQGLLEAGSH